MSHPNTVYGDASGNIWVADGNNIRILKFSPPFSSGMGASLVLGQANFTSASYGTSQTTMGFPRGVFVDSSSNVWVTDSGYNRVLAFSPPFSNGMNASLVLGQADFTSGTAGTTQSAMSGPDGVSGDSSGNIWVTDVGNSRVLEFKPPFSNGMNASLVLGQADFTSGTAGTTQSTMYGPTGVSVDSSGNIWVADVSNSRILKFSPPFSNGMNASLVIGQTNFNSRSTGLSQSTFNSPRGLFADSSGNVWVADYGFGRVLRFSPPFSNGMNASLVLGQTSFTGTASVTSQSTLSALGVFMDTSGRVWVADYYNSRVLQFTSSPPPPPGSGPPPAATVVYAYPNPFSPSLGATGISIVHMKPGETARIYSLAGYSVKSLTADSAGKAIWDAKGVSPGTYLIKTEHDKPFMVVVLP